MAQLRLLGGAQLDDDGTPIRGPAAQRHRLALLAVLARAWPAGVPRERLQALLWPEHDTASARRLLNLAVHVLRKRFGRDVLHSSGDGLSLDPEVLPVDLIGFEARAGSDPAAAVDLCAGPFLDGFYLPGAVAFEQWVDAERGRIRARLAGVLHQLASQYENAWRWRDAVPLWRRLAELEPGNGEVARRLMLALEASGDRPGALAQAREHSRYLAEEFETVPDSAVHRLEEALRIRATGRARRAGQAAGGEGTLGIMPFMALAGGADIEAIADGLTVELMPRLREAPGVRVAAAANAFALKGRGLSVTEIGRTLGVATVLEGTVRQGEGRIRVTAHLVDARSGLVLWSGVFDGAGASRFSIEEGLAGRIAAAIGPAFLRLPAGEGERDTAVEPAGEGTEDESSRLQPAPRDGRA